ncbi:hypothetical protein [Castellaniella sp. S9]|uniref:hypothetical protein n=1 Tax=Castellaniella sp. S9 TaxID=2993652 RepID=UPI0022B38A3C|nr:hypothetical protein [Castellaniella sp. S9]
MLSALFAYLQPYLAWVVAIAVGVFAVRQSGKRAAHIERLEQQLKDSEAVREADNQVVSMDDDTVRDELAKFVRKH